MLIEVHSLDDSRLDPYRNLKQSNLTRWSGIFIAEGEKLTRRLLSSDFDTISLLLGRGYLDAFAPLVKPETPLFVVPDDDVEKIVGFNFHRGVLACGRRRPGRALEDVAMSRRDATLVVCPDVQDPENMGALLRIGSALGITAMMLGRRCADAFSRRVLRVSMGAALRLPLIESDGGRCGGHPLAAPTKYRAAFRSAARRRPGLAAGSLFVATAFLVTGVLLQLGPVARAYLNDYRSYLSSVVAVTAGASAWARSGWPPFGPCFAVGRRQAASPSLA
jgi:hypothetical protein